MQFAYADPPYIRQAAKLYGKEHDYQGEVDHSALLAGLCEEFPDGWALSASSTSLQYILRLPECPENVRIASWTKPWAAPFPGVNPMYAWEPVLFMGGRFKSQPKRMDWVNAMPPNTTGLVGAKPLAFNVWVLQSLFGFELGDQVADVFPGTGGMDMAVAALEEALRTGSSKIVAPRAVRAKPHDIPALTRLLGRTGGRA